MKTLPKYFAIKRDENNPLWDKYIEWLNEAYNSNWEGDTYLYYGYHGCEFNETQAYDNIKLFKNNPTIITLEQWNECVNGEQRKIIGYKAPFDMLDGNIKKETFFTKGLYLNDWRYSCDGTSKYSIPPEIVEAYFEPVYEEKLEVRSHYVWEKKGNKRQKSAIYFYGKLTQEIVDKIKEVINE